MIEARIKITDEFVSELVSRLDADVYQQLRIRYSSTMPIGNLDLDDLSNIFSDVVKTLVDEVNDKVMS